MPQRVTCLLHSFTVQNLATGVIPWLALALGPSWGHAWVQYPFEGDPLDCGGHWAC